MGNGVVADALRPLQVLAPAGSSPLSDIIAISAGTNNSVALKTDGTVWTRGNNMYGRLGDGTTTNSTRAVQVRDTLGTGYLTKIIAVSAGSRFDETWPASHVLALDSSGAVWGWGYNGYGQLGDGTTTQRNWPVKTMQVSGVVAMATGGGNGRSMALLPDGTIWRSETTASLAYSYQTSSSCLQRTPTCLGGVCVPQVCNLHGSCVAGSCACDVGFGGTNCGACAAGYSGYPNCKRVCEAATTCNGHGGCNVVGECVCYDGYDLASSCGSCSSGYFGYPTCTLCDDAVCNDHGTAQQEGSGVCACTCGEGYAGARCDTCAAGYSGYPDCSKTSACNPATTCSGKGNCNASGGCDCHGGFGGTSCDTCASGYSGYPDCSMLTQCNPATTCSGKGNCNASGGCDCNDGFGGTSCDMCASGYEGYPDCSMVTQCNPATTCSGKGDCNASGGCDCHEGYGGVNCDACASGFSGYPDCSMATGCDAAVTCKGNGSRKSDGSCACDAGFGGADCGQCGVDHYAYPICRFCDVATTCRGNGVCGVSGDCTCEPGYAGTSCNQCVSGSYPNCTDGEGGCDDETTCSGHGVCRGDGECACFERFGGKNCKECSDGYVGYPDCAEIEMPNGESSGCSCGVSGRPSSAWFGLALGLGLVVVRRRKSVAKSAGVGRVAAEPWGETFFSK